MSKSRLGLPMLREGSGGLLSEEWKLVTPRPGDAEELFPPEYSNYSVVWEDDVNSVSPKALRGVVRGFVPFAPLSTIQACATSRLDTSRDWNADFQLIVGKPRLSPQEWRERSRAIDALGVAFQQTAEVVVRELVDAVTINTGKQPYPALKGVSEETFCVDGILYRFVRDRHGFYGNELHAQKAASHEMKGLNAIVTSGLLHVHVPLTAMLTYRGHRVVAASVVPLGRNTLVYGTRDGGRTISCSSPAVECAAKRLGETLNLATHEVGHDDGGGGGHGAVRFSTHMPGDFEIHQGTDQRLYVLSAARLMPCETPVRGLRGSNLFRRLRPELVRRNTLPLSADAFSGWGAHHAKQFNANVRDATTLLTDTLIPQLAELWNGDAARRPRTPDELKDALHMSGINLRHMGKLVALLRLPECAELHAMMVTEMAARVVCNDVEKGLRAIGVLHTPTVDEYKDKVMRLLNVLMGDTSGARHYWNNVVLEGMMYKFSFVGNAEVDLTAVTEEGEEEEEDEEEGEEEGDGANEEAEDKEQEEGKEGEDGAAAADNAAAADDADEEEEEEEDVEVYDEMAQPHRGFRHSIPKAPFLKRLQVLIGLDLDDAVLQRFVDDPSRWDSPAPLPSAVLRGFLCKKKTVHMAPFYDALARQAEGKLEEAHEAFKAELERKEEALGRNNAFLVDLLVGLAGLAALQSGGAPRARALINHALAIRKAECGDEHFFYADILWDKARILQHAGQMSMAQDSFVLARRMLTRLKLHVPAFDMAFVDLHVRRHDYGEVRDMLMPMLKHENKLPVRHRIFAHLWMSQAQHAVHNRAAACKHLRDAHKLALQFSLMYGSHMDAIGKHIVEVYPAEDGDEGVALLVESLDAAVEQCGPLHAEGGTAVVARRALDLGRLYRLSWQHDDAMKALTRAEESAKQCLDAELASEVGVSVSVEIALTLQQMQRYSEAEKRFIEAMRVANELGGPSTMRTVGVMMELGRMYRMQSQFTEADKLFGHAIQVYHEVLQGDDPRVADAYFEMGVLREAQSRNEEALVFHVKALGIRKKAFHDASLLINRSLSRIAAIHIVLKEFKDAEEMFLDAVRVRKGFDEDMHSTEVHRMIADSYMEQQHYVEAEAQYRRALDIAERLLHRDHPRTVPFLTRLGVLYHQMGKEGHLISQDDVRDMGIELDAAAASKKRRGSSRVTREGGADKVSASAVAEAYFHRALNAIQNVSPERYAREKLMCLSTLGMMCVEAGELDKADAMLSQTVTLAEAMLTPQHHEVAEHWCNMAQLRQAEGKVDSSEKMFKKALSILEQSVGATHMEFARAMHSLGELYVEMERPDDAESCFKESIEIASRHEGGDSFTVGVMLGSLGKLYAENGNYKHARRLFAKSIANIDAVYGKTHASLASIYQTNGLMYVDEGALDEALECYLAALPALESKEGVHSLAVAELLNYMAELYERCDMLEEADTALQRVLSIHEEQFGKSSPELFEPLFMLGQLYFFHDVYKDAIDVLSRARDIGEEHRESDVIDEKMLSDVEERLARSHELLPELSESGDEGDGDGGDDEGCKCAIV